MAQSQAHPLRDPASSPGAVAVAVEVASLAASSWSSRFAKRTLDVVIAVVALVVLAPLLAIVALLVARTSRGPVLFRQTRIGHRREPFTILKFRTMVADNDDAVHRAFVASQLRRAAASEERSGRAGVVLHDERITPLGARLRRTSIDELPQLLNVLRGEMSMVGPRPCLPWEAPLFESRDHGRFEVKPGLTGLWQVSGRNDLSMREALDLDIEYVRRRSTRLDLWILVRTIPAVIRCRGAR
jgi:lipopolysaccharide/colanic/teichoic acid biosynthesis glycosyltransferase